VRGSDVRGFFGWQVSKRPSGSEKERIAMAAEQNRAEAPKGKEPVIRTFARGWIGTEPEFKRSGGGVAVCRILVVGEAAGPASEPPTASLYTSGEEAERCADGLNVGDLIEGVGVLGPERKRAPRQEIVVDKEVKLWARAGVAA
jgi:hypothetical protein